MRNFLNALASGSLSAPDLAKGDVLFMKAATEGDKTYPVRKDAAAAIRAARIAAGAGEQQAADALGCSLEDYLAFEQGGQEIEITAKGITDLSKVVKKDPAELAAEMISAPKAGIPETDSTQAGDQTNPPSDPAADPNASDAQKAAAAKAAAAKAAAAKSAADKGKTPEQIALEKSQNRSSQIHVVNVNKPTEEHAVMEKAENKQKFIKNFLGLRNEAEFKKGIIAPDMFAPNSTLNPELATSMIDLIVDQKEFLGKVQTVPMNALSAEVIVWNVGGRNARQFPMGVWPTGNQLTQSINKSLLMHAKKAQIFFMIGDDVLANYRGNLPGLEASVISGFTKQAANELVDIGFNGTTDVYNDLAGSPSLTINKGWPQVLIDAAQAGQVIDVSDGGGGLDEPAKVMDALIAAGAANNPQYFPENTPFILGSQDFERHEQNLLARNDAAMAGLLISGSPQKYRGNDIVINNFMPTNTVIYSQLQNLVLGVVNGESGANGISVERFRTPGAWLFLVTMYIDFEVVNKAAAVLAKP